MPDLDDVIDVLKEIMAYVVTFVVIMILLNSFLDGHYKTGFAVIGIVFVGWILIKIFKKEWLYGNE